MPDANGNPTPDDMMGNTAAPAVNPQVQQMIQALRGGQAPTGLQAPYGVPAPQPGAGLIPQLGTQLQNQGMGQQPLGDQPAPSANFLGALAGPPDVGY